MKKKILSLLAALSIAAMTAASAAAQPSGSGPAKGTYDLGISVSSSNQTDILSDGMSGAKASQWVVDPIYGGYYHVMSVEYYGKAIKYNGVGQKATLDSFYLSDYTMLFDIISCGSWGYVLVSASNPGAALTRGGDGYFYFQSYNAGNPDSSQIWNIGNAQVDPPARGTYELGISVSSSNQTDILSDGMSGAKASRWIVDPIYSPYYHIMSEEYYGKAIKYNGIGQKATLDSFYLGHYDMLFDIVSAGSGGYVLVSAANPDAALTRGSDGYIYFQSYNPNNVAANQLWRF